MNMLTRSEEKEELTRWRRRRRSLSQPVSTVLVLPDGPHPTRIPVAVDVFVYAKHEQFVFDQVKRALAARHGVRVQLVDTAYLTGFCDLGKGFLEVCTVHGNCLVGLGLGMKLEKLITEVLDEWKQFQGQGLAARCWAATAPRCWNSMCFQQAHTQYSFRF
ncbi:hypothetical protein ACP70R_045012 [Stipagrostis hirtigluma subsp. patula]